MVAFLDHFLVVVVYFFNFIFLCNFLMKHIYSKLTLITVVFLIAGYLIVSAAWIPVSNVATGDPLSAGLWNTLVNDVNDLNMRVWGTPLWSIITGGISYIGWNIGIGTTTPGQKLSVVGIVESTFWWFKFPDGTTQITASNWIQVAPGTIAGTCNGGNSPTYPAVTCTAWACGFGYAYTCWGIATCATGYTKRTLGGDVWDNAIVYGCVKD